jgi:hypothetical protein
MPYESLRPTSNVEQAANAAKSKKKKRKPKKPYPGVPDWAAFYKNNPHYVSGKEKVDGRDRKRLARSPGMFGD